MEFVLQCSVDGVKFVCREKDPLFYCFVFLRYGDGCVGLWDTRSGAGEQRRFVSHQGSSKEKKVKVLGNMMRMIVAPV